MKLLVIGGAGFIGSHFVRHMLRRYPQYEIYNLDALTYAGNKDNIADVFHHPHHHFIHGDICDADLVKRVVSRGIEAIVNFAAETHVDRSIFDARPFLQTNILGTYNLLEAARFSSVGRFVQISTDEVYGSLGPSGYFSEATPLAPNNPYAASKAGADLLALSYFRTHRLPVLITRCSNNYGPFQYPEKLIPLMTIRALENQPLPVYGDGLNVRDWLHVEDHCTAIDLVLHRGKAGNVYNIGANNERTNLEVVQEILRILGRPGTLIRHTKDRPGHDQRYATNSAKIRSELGWKPRRSFAEGLRETVQWYVDHREWWEKLLRDQA